MSKQREIRVASYANNIRRILKAHPADSHELAATLQRLDQALLAEEYLALGKRRMDEYAIEADGVLFESTTTTNLDVAKALLPNVLANGCNGAKIVRVVTFTQDVNE